MLQECWKAIPEGRLSSVHIKKNLTDIGIETKSQNVFVSNEQLLTIVQPTFNHVTN